ncbi:MAG: DUF3570 domain-containing protein [Bdellovibrionota bacterium]
MKTLLVTCLIFVSSGASSVARAEVDADFLIRRYDDQKTQVVSPHFDISGTFNKDTMKVSASFVQDYVTSASADVVSYSSQGVIKEERNEVSTSFETTIPDGNMSVGYIQSDEHDYHSKIVSAGGTREFFQKNTVFSFGFANGNDRINSSSSSTFDERMRHQVYSLSLTQILSKTSLIQFVYDFRVENGFLASPYRRARFVDGGGNVTIRTENHPLTRNRNAFALKYNFFANSVSSTFATTYRLYQDSWGVFSHTLEERMTKEFGKKLQVSFAGRYYTQSKAKFYEDYYTDTGALFYTGNKTLATFDGYMVSVRPAYNLTEKMQIYGKAEYYKQNFKDVSDQGLQISTRADDKPLELTAFVAEVGLEAKF